MDNGGENKRINLGWIFRFSAWEDDDGSIRKADIFGLKDACGISKRFSKQLDNKSRDQNEIWAGNAEM